MNKDDGRVASPPGSREPRPSVSAASGFDPSRGAVGRLLCRAGFHKWKLSNGVGVSRDAGPLVILFDKDCRRCGKHAEGSMVL